MDIVIRAIVIFFAVFLITRMVGRRELGMNEPFDLILLVVIGDLIQQGVTQSDFSVTGTMLAVGTFAALTVALSYISFRSKSVRTVLEGNPLVLIEDGNPIDLKSEKPADGAGRGAIRGPHATGHVARRHPMGHPRDQRYRQHHSQAAVSLHAAEVVMEAAASDEGLPSASC